MLRLAQLFRRPREAPQPEVRADTEIPQPEVRTDPGGNASLVHDAVIFYDKEDREVFIKADDIWCIENHKEQVGNIRLALNLKRSSYILLNINKAPALIDTLVANHGFHNLRLTDEESIWVRPGDIYYVSLIVGGNNGMKNFLVRHGNGKYYTVSHEEGKEFIKRTLGLTRSS